MKSNASVDGLDDHRGSITRTVSDSSDSNMSDAEVDIIHDYNNLTDDEL